MGVDYQIQPLAWELARDGGAWLRERGVPFPEEVIEGRFPTLAEVIRALSEVEEWTISASRDNTGSGWSVRVRSEERYAVLEADERFKGSRPGVPAFYFYRGWPCLVIQILNRLARICGPFIVVSPDAVAVVTGETVPDQSWVDLFDQDELP